MIELSTREFARATRSSRRGALGAAVCAVLALGVACGAAGDRDAPRDAPTPLLSQETATPGDSGPAAAGQLVPVRVGAHEIRVEIADDDAERQQGLMYRESLPEDQGMLFVYGTEATRSFWMRNTLIPLDIAFIDADGVIVDIQQMRQTQTEELTTSRYPAMYALEMNLGWFASHEVEVGDRLEF